MGDNVTTRHVCLSVRGALRNKHFEGFENDDGSPASPRDVEDYLMDQLAMGREKIPFGKPCEGFDYKKGCPGHESGASKVTALQSEN